MGDHRNDVASVGTLEVGQDLDFERRWWRVQRASWTVIAIVIAAGIGGGFGRGPLCRAHATESGVDVASERIGRFNFASDIEVRLPADAPPGEARIALPSDFVRCAGVERTTPRASSESLEGSRVVYAFADASPGVDQGRPRVVFHLRPRALGACSGVITVGPAAIEVRHFVLP